MGFPKLWADVCGRPLIAHAIAAARAAAPIELIVVASSDRLADTRALAPDAQVIQGGARRRDSVAAGLAASTAPWLAIHHAARALAPPELFERGLRAAKPTGAAVHVLPLKVTVKRVTGARDVATQPSAVRVVL